MLIEFLSQINFLTPAMLKTVLLTQIFAKVKLYLYLVRTVNRKSVSHFDTKMCIGSLYVIVRRSKTPVQEEDGSVEYSFSLSASYVTGGSCLYIHENAFAYCGESNLDDCRNCKRPGCSVIECGQEDLKGKKDYNGLYPFVK